MALTPNRYAIVAMALAGDLFTKRKEQKLLFDFFTNGLVNSLHVCLLVIQCVVNDLH
jgi:hypothetical protein